MEKSTTSQDLFQRGQQSSRQKFMRKVQSIGSIDNCIKEKSKFDFLKLKQLKRIEMGKVLRNTTSIVELFGLREENVIEKQQDTTQAASILDVNFEAKGETTQNIAFFNQVDQYNYINSIECGKFQHSVSRILVPLGKSKTVPLKAPQLIPEQRPGPSSKPQKLLKPHEPLIRQNLPPILMQAQLDKAGAEFFSKFLSPTYEEHPTHFSQGKLLNGRLAEGIDQEKLNFIQKQKLLQQVKIQKNSKPMNCNLALKKVNIIKNQGSGNVLGKAIQQLNLEGFQKYKIPKEVEKSLIREKEKEIDELIFGKVGGSKKGETFLTDQKMVDMNDLI